MPTEQAWLLTILALRATADDPAFAANGIATAGSPAVSHEDLLTTVLHEMGHLAGQPDVANATTGQT